MIEHLPMTHQLTSTGRVEAFSDGVFAIAITLLVLELHEPEQAGQFLAELLEQWPAYAAYISAFSILGLVWLSHHDLFTRIRQSNSALLTRNLLLLFGASVFSFPTATLAAALRQGTRADQITAVAFYAIVSIGLALAWLHLVRFLISSPDLVADPSATPAYVQAQTQRTLTICGLSLLGVGIAFFSPVVSLMVFIAVPVFSLVFHRRSSVAGELPQETREG